jgi:hypothetical protein
MQSNGGQCVLNSRRSLSFKKRKIALTGRVQWAAVKTKYKFQQKMALWAQIFLKQLMETLQPSNSLIRNVTGYAHVVKNRHFAKNVP